MSRSKKRKQGDTIDFPLHHCVKDVYVTELRYGNKEGFEYLFVLFTYKDKELPYFLGLPTRESVARYQKDKKKIEEALKQKRKSKRDWLEEFFATYLSSSQMIEARDGVKNFKEYCSNFISLAELNNYKEQEVWLKTIPHNVRGCTVAYTPPFIKKPDNDSIILEYSNWEIETFFKN